MDTIKVRWMGKTRGWIASELNEDDSIGHDAFGRQQTNIVVETEQERNAILQKLEYRLDCRFETIRGFDKRHRKTIERVRDELERS